MALVSTEISITTANSFYVRCLYQLYQHLSAHANYSIVDSVGDYTSENDLATFAQTTSPWFVAQSDTNWPNSSITPLYWFGAKLDGYTTEVGFWTGLTVTNTYFFGVIGYNNTWNFSNKEYDFAPSMWSWCYDTHDNYTGTFWASSDEYTIVSAMRESTTTHCKLIYHGAFDSLVPGDPSAVVAAMGRCSQGEDYSISNHREFTDGNSKKIVTSYNTTRHLDVCAIGINNSEHRTSNTSDSRGRLQDESTIFLSPAMVVRGNAGSGIYALHGHTRNLHQITRNTSLVADYEKDTTNNFIKLPGGYTMKYA
jgi:hypothetical protein